RSLFRERDEREDSVPGGRRGERCSPLSWSFAHELAEAAESAFVRCARARERAARAGETPAVPGSRASSLAWRLGLDDAHRRAGRLGPARRRRSQGVALRALLGALGSTTRIVVRVT